MTLLARFFVISISLSSFNLAQISSPTKFSFQSSEQNYLESFLLGLPNNNLMFFWYDSLEIKVKSARSIDNGISWTNETTLVELSTQPEYNIDLNAVVLGSGRVLFTYRSSEYKIIYSDDNCLSWSQSTSLPTRNSTVARLRVYWSSLSTSSNGSVFFIHSFLNSPSNNRYDANGIYFIKSNDGIFWSSYNIIDSVGRNGNFVNLSASKDMVVYHDSTPSSDDIFYRLTTDAGMTWSQKELLIGGEYSQKNVRGIKDQSGKVWIFFEDEEPTSFSGITQPDINFITSTDEGTNWSIKQKFTNYKGIDNHYALGIWNGKPILSFSSSRSFNLINQKYQIYYGIAGETADTNGPPFLFSQTVYPDMITAQDPVTFRAWVLDDGIIDSVYLIIRTNSGPPSYHLMFDGGFHNDSLPNDNIYGVIFNNGFSNNDIINYDFYLVDTDGNNSGFKIGFFTVPTLQLLENYLIESNKLKLPINNRGVLAQVNINNQSGLQFEESSVLFSGGFFISGRNSIREWATGVATSTLVEYFFAGPVGSDRFDIRNTIYVVKKSDPDFGLSWQQYRFAVNNGADFYDGDSDGIYNPVDLNLNGIWDTNEDKPDMFGDETIWCVYNDGVPESWRNRIPGEPQRIDIQQTIFVLNENLNPIQNILFIRYRLVNRGTVANNFEDTYFTVWSDPDIGTGYSNKLLGFDDDLVGSDTLLNLGYCYNDSLDTSYGINPPSLGTAILQGPVVSIPGETFLDNNGNDLYDSGIDTPIDTAFVNKGLNGTELIPGAKNLGMTSFIYTDCGSVIMGEPNNVEQIRYYMSGKNILGQYTDPCNWSSGNVFGVPCSEVNPLYHYSGDPVNSLGWVHNTPCDQRMWSNIGPFNLPQNEKVDIWAAYVVGRGDNNLSSVTKLKEYTMAAHNFYKSNFSQLPLSVAEKHMMADDYYLFQNYPNPFNPSTIIRYFIPSEGLVTLKVYDLLGQEVKTLVNEFKQANKYEVKFESSGLASGVYIYRIQVNDYNQSKKMIILK